MGVTGSTLQLPQESLLESHFFICSCPTSFLCPVTFESCFPYISIKTKLILNSVVASLLLSFNSVTKQTYIDFTLTVAYFSFVISFNIIVWL